MRIASIWDQQVAAEKATYKRVLAEQLEAERRLFGHHLRTTAYRPKRLARLRSNGFWATLALVFIGWSYGTVWTFIEMTKIGY